MRHRVTGVAIATALFAVASTLPGRAEESSSSPAAAAPTQTAPTAAAPPASVPRPSIVAKSAEPAAAPVADDNAPRRQRRYAHRHYRHYAYWEPFPVYWPHFYRQRIYWNRIPWFAF